jgi:hypothetical protein
VFEADYSPRSERIDSFSEVDMSRYVLPMFVIFEKPADHPEDFIVRLFDCDQPTRYVVIKKTLEEIRDVIPAHLFRIHRDARDDKSVVETWV